MSNLPAGHKWEENYCDSGHGIDYMWSCSACGATFYVNIDQNVETNEFIPGDEFDCGDEY